MCQGNLTGCSVSYNSPMVSLHLSIFVQAGWRWLCDMTDVSFPATYFKAGRVLTPLSTSSAAHTTAGGELTMWQVPAPQLTLGFRARCQLGVEKFTSLPSL